MPWEDLTIQFGGTVIVWSSAVAGIIQILKAVKIGGNPLLASKGSIWAANLILGGAGVLIYALTQGTPLGQAALQALMAVISASGIFEGVKAAAGKGSSKVSFEA